ncbi:HhH-GPD family protein [Desulfofarcimen acetoxidans DSM 771]|uniref:DNA-3-methyladenine glycosylase II n=1 Tax=Desulfofarcimen acetoxidans (strain ATCC 49208 / DSM 771 / KCTC 5769 / VKM B-1644 / 5575) TaxID=485916 RepID=C8W0S2_DESAS|nr:DNA-3-methyladenine glycosylase [Desulfofarcimen acetoxidans]ACV63327.1 HhH-GPD family protein [Desulfofarcimen acetoxidans DSM 771]
MEIFNYGQVEIDYLKKKDKKLAEAIERIGIIEREIIPDLFAALVHSIISQQISSKAAATVWNRFLERFDEITSQKIAYTTAEEIQQCGITMKKAIYIKSIADAVMQGEFNIDELSELPDEEVCKRLSALNGIGVWTAEMLMTFSMQRPNVMSWGDLAIRRGIMMLYHHRKLDKAKFEKYKRRYSPYCTIASLYLWEIAAGR